MPRIVSLEEYRTMHRPSLKWIVPGYIPFPSTIMLVGSPKAGKSTLALQLALAIGQGGNILGQQCTQGRVLYLQLDESELTWRTSKLQRLHNHGISLSGDVLMVHPDDTRKGLNILNPSDLVYLRDLVAVAKPDVVIVDVLRETFSGDENDSGVAVEVMHALLNAMEATATFILHHIHKLNPLLPTPRPTDAARGSSYFAGRVDAVWLLHNSALTIQSRFGPDESRVAKRLESGLFAL